MKKIRKSLSQIPQKFLGAFGADFTITRSDVFMTFAAVSKNIRPVQPTSRRSKQTIHLRSNSELVQDVLRGRAVVAAEEVRRLQNGFSFRKIVFGEVPPQ